MLAVSVHLVLYLLLTWCGITVHLAQISFEYMFNIQFFHFHLKVSQAVNIFSCIWEIFGRILNTRQNTAVAAYSMNILNPL